MVDVQDTLLDPPMVNCISCCNSLQLIGQQYGSPVHVKIPIIHLEKMTLKITFTR
jgi:carbon monoxide dehydrogenase subunit G